MGGPGYRVSPPPAGAAEPEPPKKPLPKPVAKRPKAPPRPDTPEERARRLWFLAKSFLANDATDLARGKLEEIVKKYPDTDHAAMARERLKKLD